MASGLHKELTRQYSESLAREDGREVREPPAPLEFWIAEHNAERVARGEHERGWFGSRLAYMGEWQDYNLDHDPWYAHWSSAALSVATGICLGMARGAVFAATCPPTQRLRGFMLASGAASPLYIVPFVIGSQWDCWEAITERSNRREGRGDDDRPLHTTHGAVDMA